MSIGGSTSTRSDPPVRTDRRCAREGCDQPLVEITARHRRYGGDALELDPWCSTECAKAYHGVDVSRSIWEQNYGMVA